MIHYDKDIYVRAICTEKTNFVSGYQMHYLQRFDGKIEYYFLTTILINSILFTHKKKQLKQIFS